VVLLALPASLGLILLRVPLITLLFERGRFTPHSTNLLAWALFWYATGLVGHSVVEIVARAFYAFHDTRTPVLVGVAAMSLNVIFSLVFSMLFSRIGWMPHGGLALANSLATTLEMAGLLLLMRRKLGGLQGGDILLGVSQACLASLAMALGVWLWLRGVSGQPAWFVLGGGILLGMSVFALTVLALRMREARGLAGVLLNRLKT
jgi:putative peptidoglycan lipid II flippase